nr:hypothetical protein Iba_chr05eCG7860 [Ipomoea batatas]
MDGASNIYTPFTAVSACVMFPFSTIFPLIWDLGLWQKGQRHLDDIKLARRNQPLDYVRTKTDAVNLLYYYTFSAGSPEFPFKSLWFSSLVLLSFVNGNATGPERVFQKVDWRGPTGWEEALATGGCQGELLVIGGDCDGLVKLWHLDGLNVWKRSTEESRKPMSASAKGNFTASSAITDEYQNR